MKIKQMSLSIRSDLQLLQSINQVIEYVKQIKALLALSICAVILISSASGCARNTPGAYYKDDGPPKLSSIDIAAIPDAKPRHEPLSRTGNKPYEALGNRYKPMASAKGFVQTGKASWYGRMYHGRRTSSGETYDMYAMTAAHPTLPLPTYVRVTNLENDRTVIVKVNDRGPFLGGRVLDLSFAAASKLDIVRQGTGSVRVTAITDFAPTRVVNNQPVKKQPVKPSKPFTVNAPKSAAGSDSQGHQHYYIQAGAFADVDNAIKLQRRLLGLGFNSATVARFETTSRTIYRVRIGPVTGMGTANARAQALANTLGRQPRIVALSE